MLLNQVIVLVFQIRNTPKMYIAVSHEGEGWYFVVPTSVN